MKTYNWGIDSHYIPPKTYKEIYFNNPLEPNVFWIKNLSKCDIYVGLDSVPTAQLYDKHILPLSDDVTGEPRHKNKIFILNNGNEMAQIIVYSDRQESFDFNLLKKNTDTIITGVKDGLSIDVNDNGLNELFDDLIIEGANGDKHLKVYHNALSTLSNCFDGNRMRVKQIESWNIYAGTATNVTTIANNIYNIHFISNDGNSPVTLTIGGKKIPLNAGEVISDIINARCQTVTIGASGESINCRYLCSS